MGLKWAMSYKFDEESDSYVLTTLDEETNQEQPQLGEQAMFPTNGCFSDDDLDDLDDDSSE
jgi:hypothetical protein